MLKITATFLDEISWDIPHQNWGEKEWDRDFAAMKAAGINTVIMIRSGLARWMAWPCEYLHRSTGTAMPETDLLDIFLRLAEKYEMRFFLGLYHSRYYSANGMWDKEIELNKGTALEAWQKYGSYKAFAGWYICHEISVNSGNIIGLYAGLGKYCKELSGGLPVMISPFIKGIKEGNEWNPEAATGNASITPEDHEKEWRTILAGLRGAVDIVAFQDGHCLLNELEDYLGSAAALTKKHDLKLWTNLESFDRDVVGAFPPIRWEKLYYKMKIAEKVGVNEAITFDFAHFFSPLNGNVAAGNLLKKYLKYKNS